jgi:hypothetical protein
MVALSTGTVLMTTVALDGVGAGSPQTTSNGRYIMMTYNLGSTGFFSVVDTQASPDASGQYPAVPALFTNSSTINPFSPIG